jgi:hypothetical protein
MELIVEAFKKKRSIEAKYRSNIFLNQGIIIF